MFVEIETIAARSLREYVELYPSTGAVLIDGVWRETLDVWDFETYRYAPVELGEEYGRQVFDMLDNAFEGAVVLRYLVAEESDAGNLSDRLLLLMPATLLQVQIGGEPTP